MTFTDLRKYKRFFSRITKRIHIESKIVYLFYMFSLGKFGIRLKKDRKHGHKKVLFARKIPIKWNMFILFRFADFQIPSKGKNEKNPNLNFKSTKSPHHISNHKIIFFLCLLLLTMCKVSRFHVGELFDIKNLYSPPSSNCRLSFHDFSIYDCDIYILFIASTISFYENLLPLILRPK